MAHRHLRWSRWVPAVTAGLLALGACAGMRHEMAQLFKLRQGIAVTFDEPNSSLTYSNGVLAISFVNSAKQSLPDSERAQFARQVALYVAAHRPDSMMVTSVSIRFGSVAGVNGSVATVSVSRWDPAYVWPLGALVGDAAPYYPIAFACPRGDTIRVRFTADSAYVVIPRDNGPRALPHVVSGSGARYSDGTMTFWNKGDSAFVLRGDSVVMNGCAVVADSGT